MDSIELKLGRLPSEDWRLLIETLVAGVILLCLILLAGCAASSPDVPKIWNCRVPEAPLQPTPEPAMEDKTNGDLLQENQRVREALHLANTEKEKVLQYIKENCK